MQAKKLKKDEKFNLSQGYIFKVADLKLDINGKKKELQTA